MVNVLWVVATFFLQAIGNDIISIKIPKRYPNGTSSEEYLKVGQAPGATRAKIFLLLKVNATFFCRQVEPLSLMFLLSFAILLSIQFMAMLYHRYTHTQTKTQLDTLNLLR